MQVQGEQLKAAVKPDCRLPDYVAYFGSNYLAHRRIYRRRTLRLTDHEVLSSSLHHVNGEFAEFDHSLHLRQPPC
jgi:hypothetical protein